MEIAFVVPVNMFSTSNSAQLPVVMAYAYTLWKLRIVLVVFVQTGAPDRTVPIVSCHVLLLQSAASEWLQKDSIDIEKCKKTSKETLRVVLNTSVYLSHSECSIFFLLNLIPSCCISNKYSKNFIAHASGIGLLNDHMEVQS